MDKLFAEIVWLGISYLLGSIPFGLVLVKFVKGIDLRDIGSGNIGTTNVIRAAGKKFGALTFLLDLSKGLIPVIIAKFMSTSNIFVVLVGLAAILGHIYSVFLKFKGGKGVATTIGVFFALSPTLAFVALVPSLFFMWLSGYVSLGSLMFVTIMPILFLFSMKFTFFGLSIIIFGLIYWTHRENILRLAKGIENPWRTSEDK